ncbi:diguanylate cyclase [Marinicella sp. W31]|uniref:diguanylate cyclase n=1 Tax=Marinicella sp. W31 TaxID=3023713 RepID=UPI003757690E
MRKKYTCLLLLIVNIQVGFTSELRQILRETDTDWSCGLLSFHQSYYDFSLREQQISDQRQSINHMSDQQKLRFYFIASQTLSNESPPLALEYANLGFKLAQQLQNHTQQLFFSMLEWDILLELRPIQKTLPYLKGLKELKAELEALPRSYDKGMIYLMYVRINDVIESRYEQLSALHAAVHMLESLPSDQVNTCANQLLGLLYNELGHYYSVMKDGKKSRDYHTIALTAFQQNNDLSSVGVAKYNLGLISLKEEKYEEAISYFEHVIALKQQLKEGFGVALSHMHMGAIYNKIGESEQAYKHLKIAIPLLEMRQANSRLALAYAYLGEAQHRLGEQQADSTLLKALDLAKKYLPPIARLQVYNGVLEHLSVENYTHRKHEILAQLLDIQAIVSERLEQDIGARTEAENLLNQQRSQNIVLAQMSGVQEQNLVLQKQINTQQEKWIIGLATVVLALLWSVWRQIKANREKTILANTDYLTGLKNRRSFYDKLRDIYTAAEKGRIRNFLLIMDIDHFKQVNDNYGHSMGDVVLTELSKLIDNHHQNCECTFRIGGEEFAFVCAFKNNQEVVRFAEMTRKNIAQHDWTFGQIQLDITVSIGISAIDKNQPMSDVVKEADRALYKAKEAGRNRVVLQEFD